MISIRPVREVLDRVVGAAVAERQLERLEADGAAEELVAEADPEDRPLADELADGRDDVVERGRVAGPVGEEDEVGVVGEDVLRRGVAGQQRHPAAALAELADDRELDPGVDADDVGPVAVEHDRLGRRHRAGEVGALHRGLGGDPLAGLGDRRRRREDPAAHRAGVADVADERPGVDPGDRRDAAVVEPVEPAALGGRAVLAVLGLAHDHGAGVDGVGLHRRRR